MCSNPFKIHDEVTGDYMVERATTHVVDVDFNKYELKWREIEGEEVLTLNEILEQVQDNYILETGETPFIRVIRESGLWGVIFEVGNYDDDQWIVHGITKGYA